ncbi:hypothetical protein ABGB17_10095 [Sphaerisporangium sp. B11E5]|uniref:hypothetical protein n=1 Tax=Sphaerisporangium sp. B11E5 TaxID=3153563 RepID=UPI00325D89BF
MPSLGPAELIVLILLIVVIIGLVVGVTGRSRRRDGTTVAVPAPVPQDLEQLVGGLVRERRQIQAIKELRQRTGLGLADAKAVVDGVAAGQPLHSHPIMARFRPVQRTPLPSTPQDLPPDLATRVRQLKAAGREEQAIFLVRGETGMEEHEARLFVDSL